MSLETLISNFHHLEEQAVLNLCHLSFHHLRNEFLSFPLSGDQAVLGLSHLFCFRYLNVEHWWLLPGSTTGDVIRKQIHVEKDPSIVYCKTRKDKRKRTLTKTAEIFKHVSNNLVLSLKAASISWILSCKVVDVPVHAYLSATGDVNI